MSYHDEIMNLRERFPDYMREADENLLHHYRIGHKDARHDAAEIANQADRVIADLLEACEAYASFEEHACNCADCDEWGPANCREGGEILIKASDLRDVAIAKAKEGK